MRDMWEFFVPLQHEIINQKTISKLNEKVFISYYRPALRENPDRTTFTATFEMTKVE